MTHPALPAPYIVSRDIQILVRDADLQIVGEIDPGDLDVFQYTDVHAGVGTWQLTTNANSPIVQALATPGAGIVFIRDDVALISGPVDSINKKGTGNGIVTWKIIGSTDDIILKDLAYPDPALADPATTPTEAYDTRTGVASTVMYGYVSDNIGPTAPLARRRTELSMAPDTVIGDTVKFSARYDDLNTMLNELSVAGGVGYRVVQVGQNLEFQVYDTTDKSAQIRFSIDNETLDSYEWTQKAPEVTRIIVAGTGQGTERTVFMVMADASYIAEALWGQVRVEFSDQRSTSDPAQLTQYAMNRLEDGGISTASVKFDPVDTAQIQFGRDYQLGDIVSVIVDNIEVTDIVQQVTVKMNSNGVETSIAIGNPEAVATSIAEMLIKRQRQAQQRISQIERNQ